MPGLRILDFQAGAVYLRSVQVYCFHSETPILVDISASFQPLPSFLGEQSARLPAQTCGQRMHLHLAKFPAWRQADWLMIGCPDPSKAEPYAAANQCRAAFMALMIPHEQFSLADLGNWDPQRPGAADTLGELLEFLQRAKKKVLLLGGEAAAVLHQIQAAHAIKGPVTWVDVDARFGMRDSAEGLMAETVKHFAFAHEADKLFSFTNLGYQRPFTTEGERSAIESLHHEAIRYGHIQENIEAVEPALRTADVLSIALGAVQQADAPAALHPVPGGFSATEIFRLARYAGLAYALDSLHIHSWRPSLDIRQQTSQLVAHILWYVLDGFYHQQPDYPLEDRSNVRRYTVKLHASVEQIDFYRHAITGRWWMEVPYPDSLAQANGRVFLVACSERDYEIARMDDIPERWWTTFHKLKS